MALFVVTDSAADLTPDMCARWRIEMASLIVTSGDQSYQDTQLDREKFWRLAGTPQGVKTSQPPAGAFHSIFQRLVDQGHQVLCLTVTSKHSGTFNSAWTAAREFGQRVQVLDSLSLSFAQGWQALHAAELAAAGQSRDEIVAALQSLRQRTQVLIYLDSTDFLRRGGRAAKLMPHIQRLIKRLRLHPILNVVEGELKLFGVVRSRKKAIARMTEHLQGLPALEKLAVMHIRAEQAGQQMVSELARATGVARGDIYLGEAGVVLASHAGAGVIAAMAVAAE